MKTTLKDSLKQSLRSAKLSYNQDLREEQGGFILKDPSGGYSFVPVRNANTGKPIAVSLYTADKAEFAQKVLTPCITQGYEVYASFHTHPEGYPAWPSRTDLSEIFTGHPVNYIYAPKEDVLNKFTYVQKSNIAQWATTSITT